MAGFAVEDMVLKLAAADLPAWQVMVTFGALGSLVFLIAARLRGEQIAPPEAFQPIMLVRGGFDIMGRLFYTLAFIHAPLAFTTMVLQASPLVVVAGAALVFGESVGWRRWLAIFAGFAGVALMIRPDANGVALVPALYAVLGMLGFAGRDLATRASPRTLGPATLGVWGFLAIFVAGLVWSLVEGRPAVFPGGGNALWLCLAVLFGVSAYTALTMAMRTGEIASVAPFRYTRILFGVGLGVAVFGESLDTLTIIGAAIVVTSGLYIVFRGRRILRGRAKSSK